MCRVMARTRDTMPVLLSTRQALREFCRDWNTDPVAMAGKRGSHALKVEEVPGGIHGKKAPDVANRRREQAG